MFGHRDHFVRERIRVPSVPAEHAMLEGCRKRRSRGLRPGGVAVSVFEHHPFVRQLLHHRRRAAVVSIQTHVIGAARVYHVKDYVWPIGGAPPAEGRSGPESNGPGPIRFGLQRDAHRLAGEMGEVHGTLRPARLFGVALLEQGLGSRSRTLGADPKRDGRVVTQDSQAEIESRSFRQAHPKAERSRRVREQGPPHPFSAAHVLYARPLGRECGLFRDQADRQNVQAGGLRGVDHQAQFAPRIFPLRVVQ
jgi:hypothetical protein